MPISSCRHLMQCLQAQHLRQKRFHDSHGFGEPFQVGDRVWLYTPVVPKSNTKKFTSFWKGPYTVVDKPGDVTYKIQLIGGTQTFVVHRNQLKPCHTPPAFDVNRKAHPVSHEYLSPPTTYPVEMSQEQQDTLV